MYIENFLNDYTERHLAEFARNCGLELDKYILCEDCIKVRLKKPFDDIKYTYSLFDYYIEESDTGFPTMGTIENLPMVQKEWRKYLRSKFGNQYVLHFNTWLDNQKLPYISNGKYT
jgi:hypothetical protein